MAMQKVGYLGKKGLTALQNVSMVGQAKHAKGGILEEKSVKFALCREIKLPANSLLV
jgi:hypothetical protein